MTPMQRYEWATSDEGWLTVAGWEALSRDLRRDADRLRLKGNRRLAIKADDRALDCRNRAQRLRAA